MYQVSGNGRIPKQNSGLCSVWQNPPVETRQRNFYFFFSFRNPKPRRTHRTVQYGVVGILLVSAAGMQTGVLPLCDVTVNTTNITQHYSMLPLDSTTSSRSPTAVMSRKVVVVLGGNGYLGQRIVNSVLRKGANVLCVSRSGKAPPHYVLPTNLPSDVQVTWHKGG